MSKAGEESLLRGLQIGKAVSQPWMEGSIRKDQRQQALDDQATQLRNHLLIQAAQNPELAGALVDPSQVSQENSPRLMDFGGKLVDPQILDKLTKEHEQEQLNNKLKLESAIYGMKPHLILTKDGYAFDKGSGALQDVTMPGASPAPQGVAPQAPQTLQPQTTDPQSQGIDVPNVSLGNTDLTINQPPPEKEAPNPLLNPISNALNLAEKRKADQLAQEKSKADINFQNKSQLQKDQQTFTGEQNQLNRDSRETLADKRAKAAGLNPEDLEYHVSKDAQDILEGRNTSYNIRQTMGRSDKTKAYMEALRDEIRKADPKFDFIASDAGGKAASSQYFQRSMAAVNTVLPNIDKFIELSNQVPRGDYPAFNGLLQKVGYQVGNQKVTNFKQAQKLISDEIGVALGSGTMSDMKLQLGFDVTDSNVSPDVFASNMEIVREFLNNRKKGLSGLRYKSPTVQDSSDGSTQPSANAQTMKVGRFTIH